MDLEINLVGKYGSGRRTWVSLEDIRQNYYDWSVAVECSGYERVRRTFRVEDGKRVTLILAREVLSSKLGRPVRDGWEAHHLDGDPFNNRRSNLQELPRVLHRVLVSDRLDSSSAFRGVSKVVDRRKDPYQGRIRMNGIQNYQFFSREALAAEWWNQQFVLAHGYWFDSYPELDMAQFLNRV